MKKIMLFITSLTLVAQQVSAKDDVEFSYKGVFSIEPGKAVVFATTNCKNTGVDTERFQWQDGGKYAGGEDHVLSSDEWTYLIVTRDADKEQKDALGTVNNEKGLILLPDDWVQPNDVPAFKPVTQGAHYDQNIYDAEQWEKMEEAGAIFLPCQGYAFDTESGHTVENENDHGVYWARDKHSGSEGKCLRFDEETIHDKNWGPKTNYYSVRLVRNVMVFDENDSQELFASKFNDFKTFDDHYHLFVRRYLLHNGYFNTICLPFEFDFIQSPLKDAEVFTVTSGTVVDGCLQVNIASMGEYPIMERGVPYLIRWTKDNDSVPLLVFHNVPKDNWVEHATDAGKSGDDGLTYQGFFGMTHIEDETNGANEHYNFFLGAENELFWPTDGSDSNAKMKGFRAYFSLTPSASAVAPRYRGMPAKLQEINVTAQEDEATKLNQPSATLNCPKVFDADKVVIILDGKKYSIGGQEL
ncbi:MAG: hypothetical protein MJY55_01800 [Bacteroidales bacterium]|nr:hypothetical protein [Bacteroidales bacterium]